MAVTLDQILATTREGLPALAARRRLLERDVHDALPPGDFASALRRPTVALIAEVKRRSPSAGSRISIRSGVPASTPLPVRPQCPS